MSRRPDTRPRARGGGAHIALGMLLGLAIPLLGWVGTLVWDEWGANVRGDDESDLEDWMGEYIPNDVPTVLVEPDPPRVVYLNREGAHLTAGVDDNRQNVSALVENAGLEAADVPAFVGSNRRWNEIVGCVRDRFSAFDVQIVDQRPVRGAYVMVMVGGRPDVLEGGEPIEGRHADSHDHSRATGLSPFNGQVIADPIVMVFSRKLREHARRTCETIGQEVAHAYGLDHAMHCGEIMSYLRPCGRRRFRDEDLDCGEHETRKCNMGTGNQQQNSHQRLLEILGPATTE